MSATEKNMELLRKLKALAEQGVGGERENAQRLLSRLMKKYGVEDADLSDDIPEEHGFTYHNPQERALLHQLFDKIVTGREIYRYVHGEGSKTKLFVACTKAEAIQIEVEYEFYRELWREEADWLFRAFIQKHRIFDTKPGHSTSEISDEDLLRLTMMMAGLKDATPLAMITEGGD